MEENGVVVEEKESAQSIYGDNAILSGGSEHNIEIQSNGSEKTTETITLDANGNPVDPNSIVTHIEEENKNPDGKPEEILEVDPNADPVDVAVSNQIEAGKALEVDLASKGVDFKALETEFQNNGEMSAESLAILEKAGYPKPVVDAFINGWNATATQFESKVLGFAGGKENYVQVLNNIKNMGQKHVDAYNLAIETGNLAQIEMLINGVQSRIEKARGTAKPSVLSTASSNTQTSNGFKSQAEVTKAMSDRRYGRDASYTKAVEAKLVVSNF